MEEPTNTPVWATPTPYPVVELEENIDLSPAYDNFYTIAEHGVQIYQATNQNGGLDLMLWIPIMFIVFRGFKNIRKRVRDL